MQEKILFLIAESSRNKNSIVKKVCEKPQIQLVRDQLGGRGRYKFYICFENF